MKNQSIDFYFDFLSPYSYLAWTWVRERSENFNFYPVSIASIVAHYETKGPAQIAPKRNYLFKDLLRYTKLHNIPFTTPAQLPFNALYALRLALNSVSGKKQKEVIDAIFRAGWERGVDIGSDDVLRNTLAESGLDVDELFLKMESKDSRVELKKNIEKAFSQNVFGVPTFICGEELFWGNDSIVYLEMWMQGNDPLDSQKYQAFLSKHTF